MGISKDEIPESTSKMLVNLGKQHNNYQKSTKGKDKNERKFTDDLITTRLHNYIAPEELVEEDGSISQTNGKKVHYDKLSNTRIEEFRKSLGHLSEDKRMKESGSGGHLTNGNKVDEALFYAAMVAEPERESAALQSHLLTVLNPNNFEKDTPVTTQLAMTQGGSDSLKRMQYVNIDSDESGDLPFGKEKEELLKERQKIEATKKEKPTEYRVQTDEGKIAEAKDYNAILPPKKVVDLLILSVQQHTKLYNSLVEIYKSEKGGDKKRITAMEKKVSTYILTTDWFKDELELYIDDIIE